MIGRKILPIVPYTVWNAFTPTLPDLYWNVDSHEERIKRICLEICKLIAYSDELADNLNIDRDELNKLIQDFEDFKDSGFEDYYEAQIKEWIENNIVKVLESILNQGVFFGLTDDGYFCANVVWQLMVYFDTIADYNSDDYGRLVLNY